MLNSNNVEAGLASTMRVRAYAPVNILDIGGWTDTAYAEHGAVLSCAINGGVTVEVWRDASLGRDVRLTVSEAVRADVFEAPLLLRALAKEFEVEGIRAHARMSTAVASGLDGVAALAVALAAALSRWSRRSTSPLPLALLAHRHMADLCGEECGLHGCLAAAFGGVGLYRFDPYPRAFHLSVPLGMSLLTRFERSLLVAFTGRRPYAVGHRRLAEILQQEPRARELHWLLRVLPYEAMTALTEGDLTGVGEAMREQADIQRQLCPGVYTPEVAHLEQLARRHGAFGCAVNGMGGSVTILTAAETMPGMRVSLHNAGYNTRPVHMESAGVRVRYDAYAPTPSTRMTQAPAPAAQGGE